MSEEKNRQIEKKALDSMLPREWVMGLLDKAVLDLARAREALLSRDYETTNREIIHAENILLELEASILPIDEAASRTMRFLHLLAHQLLLANVNKDISLLDETTILVRRLRNTFAAISKKL